MILTEAELYIIRLVAGLTPDHDEDDHDDCSEDHDDQSDDDDHDEDEDDHDDGDYHDHNGCGDDSNRDETLYCPTCGKHHF